MRVGGSKDLVPIELGDDKLTDDISVGEADDKAVLGRVIFVFGLGDQASTSIVIGLALSTTLRLGLEAREVGAC